MQLFSMYLQTPTETTLNSLTICTWFLQLSNLKYQVWWTGIFPRLNWIFLPAVAWQKIQVWNRLKIQFIKLDISNWRFEKKSSADRYVDGNTDMYRPNKVSQT